jgi:hypothetical protein
MFDSDAEEQGTSNGAIHSCSILNFGGDFLCQRQKSSFFMGFAISRARTIVALTNKEMILLPPSLPACRLLVREHCHRKTERAVGGYQNWSKI